MNTLAFILLALIAVAGTAAAMSLRHAVHSVLALTLGFLGYAGLYLLLGAQFVGFTQVLVYVGAVSILAVFAIMTTQSKSESTAERPWITLTPSAVKGLAIAAAVLILLAVTLLRNATPTPATGAWQPVSVLAIGQALMHAYALPLEIVGLLLTAAMVGAVIVAMPSRGGKR